MAFKKLKFWFDKELAIMLADKIIVEISEFNKSEFVKKAHENVTSLELKDRVEVFADLLNEYIPNQHFHILTKILGPENIEETGMFTNFYWIMPIAKWVEKYGLDTPNISFDLIGEITKRNTGEYAIRPFLNKHPTLTVNKMKEWALSENFHLRRLASESMRIRLPWAKKLSQFVDNPDPILSVIDLLKDDPIKYVQKSVANNLNDLLKDNPTVAIEILTDWSKSPSPSRKWIIKHALRNLIKKDDPWAILLLKNL